MYCDYLLKGARAGIKRCKEQFFMANSGLVIKFSIDLRVRECEKEDFYQLCYLAFEQALKVYVEGAYSFLSYYRQCHQLNDYIKNIVKIYLLHYLTNIILNFHKTKIFDFVKI